MHSRIKPVGDLSEKEAPQIISSGQSPAKKDSNEFVWLNGRGIEIASLEGAKTERQSRPPPIGLALDPLDAWRIKLKLNFDPPSHGSGPMLRIPP